MLKIQRLKLPLLYNSTCLHLNWMEYSRKGVFKYSKVCLTIKTYPRGTLFPDGLLHHTKLNTMHANYYKKRNSKEKSFICYSRVPLTTYMPYSGIERVSKGYIDHKENNIIGPYLYLRLMGINNIPYRALLIKLSLTLMVSPHVH